MAYPPMEKSVHLYGVMILFCIVALLGAIFTYFVVDETKGKNLDMLNSADQGLDVLKNASPKNEISPVNESSTEIESA